MPGIKKIEPGNLGSNSWYRVENIVIGAGVEIVEDPSRPFNGGFSSFYNQNGKQAGSYTYTTSTGWSKNP